MLIGNGYTGLVFLLDAKESSQATEDLCPNAPSPNGPDLVGYAVSGGTEFVSSKIVYLIVDKHRLTGQICPGRVWNDPILTLPEIRAFGFTDGRCELNATQLEVTAIEGSKAHFLRIDLGLA